MHHTCAIIPTIMYIFSMYICVFYVLLFETFFICVQPTSNTSFTYKSTMSKIAYLLHDKWNGISSDEVLVLLDDLHGNGYVLWEIYIHEKISEVLEVIHNDIAHIHNDISLFMYYVVNKVPKLEPWCLPNTDLSINCNNSIPCVSEVLHTVPNQPCGFWLTRNKFTTAKHRFIVCKLFYIKLYISKLEMASSDYLNSLTLSKKDTSIANGKYVEFRSFYGSHPPCEFRVDSYEILLDRVVTLIGNLDIVLQYHVIDVQVQLHNHMYINVHL